MALTVDATSLQAAPKALLHDHLDGGLRVATVLELADRIGWTPQLPTTDPDALQAWFTAGAASGDLLAYLATFEHTLAVMPAEREGSFEGFELGDELGASVVEGALDGRLLGDELGALEKVPHPSSTWIWM